MRLTKASANVPRPTVVKSGSITTREATLSASMSSCVALYAPTPRANRRNRLPNLALKLTMAVSVKAALVAVPSVMNTTTVGMAAVELRQPAVAKSTWLLSRLTAKCVAVAPFAARPVDISLF